jgi:hypothetical protein
MLLDLTPLRRHRDFRRLFCGQLVSTLGTMVTSVAIPYQFRMTIWNETIPAHLRGRLAGVEMISYLTGPLLGNARAGWMASAGSNRFSIVAGGLVCTGAVLLCIPLLPAFWRYRRAAPAR